MHPKKYEFPILELRTNALKREKLPVIYRHWQVVLGHDEPRLHKAFQHVRVSESATPSVTLGRCFSLPFAIGTDINSFMYSSITPQQANGFRMGGYFMIFVGLLTVFGWAGAIQDYYVTEHQWPAASATVYSLTERSKEVQPASTRQRNYQVFWMEFLVILDLPQGQCPGAMVPMTTTEPQCRGVVETPHSKSRADAIDWATRHPQGSQITVHYDPQSRRMALGGESVFNIYPWGKIFMTAMILLAAVLMIRAGRRSSRAQNPSGIPEIKEE